jgi:hypothetical protein
MTLVPTTEVELHQFSELDSELTNILKNKELNQDDKNKLYTNVLGKYKKFEEKVYPNENFMPDNQENFHLITPYFHKMFFSRIKYIYYCTQVQIFQLKKQLKNLL